MNALWSYFWPIFATGLVFGAIAGSVGFRLPTVRPEDRLSSEKVVVPDRRAKRTLALSIGIGASVAIAALWHGPLGAADRFAAQVERSARTTLYYNEIPQVTARLHHGPLTRQLILVGTADEFQRSELMRIMGALPGVSSARWSAEGGGPPLILEGIAIAVLGFLFGLLLAYLIELRRRYNMQWNW
ncbi:MAG: hypothetical protein ABI454_12210 [Sphingomicrobium sp.]